MHKTFNELFETVQKEIPESQAKIIAPLDPKGDHALQIHPQSLLKVLRLLKHHEDFEFQVLEVITGTDFPEAKEIELTYVLATFTKQFAHRDLLLKVRLPRNDQNAPNPSIDSATSLFKSANFLEREVFDMIGVEFQNHPDHRRILCPDDWKGHPLRKDYTPEEKYRGMLVNPPHKINTEDHFFGKKLRETMDPKQVVNSWKSDDEVEA